ncbi:sensor histidine kinase [Paenibacillus silviterrae]|uniref:sensor histidine kinase n=1 Tax=Paenibacillus silviterrae TaxID=3242194 RepID=UPI002543B7B9|nr:PAS domain S-box protein [Paenibacillus chinjuensis]
MNNQEIIVCAQLLLKNSPNPVFILDLHDQIIWCNHAFKSSFCTTDDSFDLNEIRPLDRSTMLNFEKSRISITDGENKEIGCIVTLKDELSQIDLIKVLEEKERYQIIAENTYDAIVLVDSESTVQYVSPSFESLFGYKMEEYLGMDAFGVIHSDDREYVSSIHLSALKSRQVKKLEYRVIHAEGNTVYVESHVKPVLDSRGNVKSVVVVVRDVTERKTAEKLLENILDNINAAVWTSDKDFSHFTLCSKSIEKTFAIPREEIMLNPKRLHDHIHFEDTEMIMGKVKSTLDKGTPVIRDFRWIHIQNETRWGRLIVHPYINSNGEVERLDGMILDITDKVLSELALEESEQRYRSLFDNNLDGVFSVDLNNFCFVNSNHAFELITGMKDIQLTNSNFLSLIVEEDRSMVSKTLSEVMRQGQPNDIECRLIGSLLDEKIVSITFVPIFLKNKLNGIHGIVKDITQRKKEERELIQSEKRYRFLQQSINRFSTDLADVMKVAELEGRLIEEVQYVLESAEVSIEEVPSDQKYIQTNNNDKWIKIGEKQQKVYLRIKMEHTLPKMEEEWLMTVVHYATILYDNLQLIEGLMKRLENMVKTNETPKWMLRLLFNLSEKERSSLSSDLHDSVLQDLIIWYRKLESIRSFGNFDAPLENELKQIEEGLLDAIHQIRITCNELRPPFLLKMGLVESLKSLFEHKRLFCNYEIEFIVHNFNAVLNEEQILGLYRIVQELLNNASKHSKAEQVKIKLLNQKDHIYFSYSDDGVGVDLSAFTGSFQNMGIAGLEKRVISMEGKVEFHSAPQQGFHVDITIPIF